MLLFHFGVLYAKIVMKERDFLNLLTWPISVVWGIPEAAVDANRINERELIYYYTFNPAGQEALRAKGYEITASGRLAAVPTTGKNR